MALQVRVAPSKVIWRNLLICVILFYTVYYVVLGMCCVMLKVYELDVLAPFDFKTNPSWLNTNYKVTWKDFVSPGEGRNGDVMGSANGNVIPAYSSVHSLEFRGQDMQ
ncbi:putative transmembrane protein 244 [Dama dama]|uniref:putative transmembrane protein 244 n=1 Tax=Dama dama TaxID=30532 RepID=UPI002A371C8A|nr:putative transmembrane protein 244 [Dama dama]